MLADPIATVLGGVDWSFARNRYKDVPSFIKGVVHFHTRAHGAAPAWQPDAIVIPVDTIRLRLAPRLVVSGYGGALEAVERKDDRMTTVRSAGGFSAANLLFHAHNALRDGLEDAPDALLHQIVQVKRAELFEPALYEVRTKYWIGSAAERPQSELARGDLLRDVLWSFRECGAIKDRDAFVERVQTSEKEIRELRRKNGSEEDADDSTPWFQPDELAIAAPMIAVSYMVNHKDLLLVLRASSPSGFTQAELLHAIHNDAAPRMARTDHVFFEGLSGPKLFDILPPVYEMSLGS